MGEANGPAAFACDGNPLPARSPSSTDTTLRDVAATTGTEVLAGCLRNATAVADRCRPAGERWGLDIRSETKTFGPLRPCVEDQLGAGPIVAAKAIDIHEALTECSSGRELAAAGHANDVKLAAMRDTSGTVPVLRNGILEDS